MTQKQYTEQKVLMTTAHYNHQKGLTAHALFKVSNNAMSQDLVQDTFMKTWKYLLRGGKIITMKSFLYHILNDLIIDSYRKHKSVSLEVLVEKGFEPRETDSERLLDFIDGKIAIRLIEKLPEIYSGIIRMRYVQDLSLKEISLLTGQTTNNIAVKVHRGLNQLKLFYNDKLN